MTEDEDNDSHSGTGETHMQNSPGNESDVSSWSGCPGKPSPGISDSSLSVGGTAFKPEVCHQDVQEFARLEFEKTIFDNISETSVPVFKSSDCFQNSEITRAKESQQSSEEPCVTCGISENSFDEEKSLTTITDSSSYDDESSLASNQSNGMSGESDVCENPHTGSQFAHYPSSPSQYPMYKFSKFAIVTDTKGYPVADAPTSSPEPKPSATLESKTDVKSCESESFLHSPESSFPEMVDQNHEQHLENIALVDHVNPQVQAPVIHLGRPKAPLAFQTHASYTGRPNDDLISGIQAPLLSYALKYVVSPKQIKIFNIKYHEKRLPQLVRHFVELIGQSANGLTCLINDVETCTTCQACCLLQSNHQPLSLIIRHPSCIVYNEPDHDMTFQDAILMVISADAGLVRLRPNCPAMWEHWTHFTMENGDLHSCFIKAFTQKNEIEDPACVFTDIQQGITCQQWPTEIKKKFIERKRKSNWLDQSKLEEITNCECLVLPYKNGSRCGIDWEVVFPKSEKCLADMLTNEQQHWFFIFQLAMQHQLLNIPNAGVNIEAELQVLRHLDHVLFHACDEIKDYMWNASPGYCFLVLLKKLNHFLAVKHLPHYIVRNRNLLCRLSDNDFISLGTAIQEILKNPLQVFQTLAEKHRFTHAWVSNELSLCNRFTGGYVSNMNAERVLFPLVLRMSKEFMRKACPQMAFECLEDVMKEVDTLRIEGNNLYTTDVSGFFSMIARSEKDYRFLCRLFVYLKLSQHIDLSSELPDIFTNLQNAVGMSYPLPKEIQDLPFPTFTEENVIEKILLLEQLAFQIACQSQNPQAGIELLKCINDIAARAIESLKANEMLEHSTECGHQIASYAVVQRSCGLVTIEADIIYERNVASMNMHPPGIVTGDALSVNQNDTRPVMNGETCKVVRSLKESQFRCLWNLFRCYKMLKCPMAFRIHLDELEGVCEQLGDPTLFKACGKILRCLGYNDRGRQADTKAEIRANVKFGVWREGWMSKPEDDDSN